MYHLAYDSLKKRDPKAASFVLSDLQEAAMALGELSRQWGERQAAK